MQSGKQYNSRQEEEELVVVRTNFPTHINFFWHMKFIFFLHDKPWLLGQIQIHYLKEYQGI